MEPLNIQKMFNEIAPKYDFLNGIISFGCQFFVKKKAVCALKVKSNSKILDLCAGTGDLGRIATGCAKDIFVIGVDYSDKMLEIAKSKNPNIEYIQADACKLPFEDNTFDYILMGFGLRNISDKNTAMKEVYRVLKKDGLFLHLDFGEKNIFSKIFGFFVIFFAKFFSSAPSAYEYLIKSSKDFYKPKEIIEYFKSFNFVPVVQKKLCLNVIAFQVLKK